MKRLVAVVLVSLLVAPPMTAAQPPAGQSDWSRVRKVGYGTSILVTLDDGRRLALRVLGADESALYGFQTLEGKLTGRVERTLADVSATWTRILTGSIIVNDKVRISLDGIFDDGRKVADVQQAPRDGIRMISGPVRQRGSARSAAILAGIGGFIGLSMAASLAMKDCGGSCSDEKAGMAVALVGFPVGLGVAGYFAGSHTEEGVIYQAPPTAGAGLVDVPWERLRLALPPSLQGAGAAQKPKRDVRPSPAPSGGAKGSPWSVTF